MMKNFKFLVILMCLSLCFGGTVYAAQVQRTNGDDLEIELTPYRPSKTPDRSENILLATGQILQNPFRLVLSLPERLGNTMVIIRDAQTDAILSTTTVNTIQESIITFNLKQGSGHFILTIVSAEYEGEGEFTL